ncbi:hypothetical protein ACO0RG_001565 [Hanseniaspora osmophila]
MKPTLAKGGHLDYLFDKLDPKTKEEQERRQKLEDEQKTYLSKYNKNSKTTFRSAQDQRKAQVLKKEKKFPQYGGSTLLNKSDGPVLDIGLPKKLPKREDKQKNALGKIDQKLNVLEGNKAKLEKNIENYNRIYGTGDLPSKNESKNGSKNVQNEQHWYSNVFGSNKKKLNTFTPQVPKPIYLPDTEKTDTEKPDTEKTANGPDSLEEFTKPETVLNEEPRADVLEDEDDSENVEFFDSNTDGAEPVEEDEVQKSTSEVSELAVAQGITKPLEQPQESTVVPVNDENLTVEPTENTKETDTGAAETPEVPKQSTVVPVSDENITVEPIANTTETDTGAVETPEVPKQSTVVPVNDENITVEPIANTTETDTGAVETPEVPKQSTVVPVNDENITVEPIANTTETDTGAVETPEVPKQSTVVPVKKTIAAQPTAIAVPGQSTKDSNGTQKKSPKLYDDTFYITKEDSKAIKQQYDTKISSLDKQLQQFPSQYTKGLENTDYKTLMAKYSAMDALQKELNTLLGKQIELDALLKVGKNKKSLELQRLNQLNLKKHKLDKLHKRQRHLHREKKRALINAKKSKRNDFNEKIRSENAKIKQENEKITTNNNETLKSNADIKKKNAHFQALKRERAEKYPETHGHYAAPSLTPATTRATHTTTHTVHTTGSTTTNSDSIVPSDLHPAADATTSVISEPTKPVEKETNPLAPVSSASHAEEPETENVVADDDDDDDATAEIASEATSYIPGEISENEEDLADIEDNEEQIDEEFQNVSQDPLITADEKKQYNDQKFNLESYRLDINKKLDQFNTLQQEITAILTKPTTRTTLQTTPKMVAQPSATPSATREVSTAAGFEPAYQLKDLKKLGNQINAPSDDELTKLSDLAESSEVDETIAPKETLIAPIAVVDPIALESEPEPSPIPTREPTPEPEVAAAAALVPVGSAGPVVPAGSTEGGTESAVPATTNKSVEPTDPEETAGALVPTEEAGPVATTETTEPVSPVATNKSTEPALAGAVGAVVPTEPAGPVVPAGESETPEATEKAEPTNKTLGGIAVVAPVIPLDNVVPAAPASAGQSGDAGVPLNSVVPEVSRAPAQDKAVEPAVLSEVKPADSDLPVEKPTQILPPVENNQNGTFEHAEKPTAVAPPVEDEKDTLANPVENETNKESKPRKSLVEQMKDIKPEVVEEEVTTVQPITLAPGEEPPAPTYHSKIEEEVKTPTSSTFTQTTIKSPAEFKDLPSTILADGKQDKYVSSPLNKNVAGTSFTKNKNNSESSLFSEYSEEEIVSAPNTETHSLAA